MRRHKNDKRVIIIGIILALAVILASVLVFFGVSSFVEKTISERQDSLSDELSEELQKHLEKESGQASGGETSAIITATPTPTADPRPTIKEGVPTVPPTPIPTATPVATATPTPTPTPTPTEEPTGPLTATVLPRSSVNLSGYSPLGISDAMATSTLTQEGVNNSVYMLFDGDDTTSWQEGSSGNGEGCVIYVNMGYKTNVRYITFKLGNWRDELNYYANGTPSAMTLWIGDETVAVSFPHEMTEFCVALSKDVFASEIYVRIDSVYAGEYPDTCISSMVIYGR